MTLRDQFAAAVAPGILNVQLMSGALKMKMEMDFNEDGSPKGATSTTTGTINYDEVAIESYMLADALLRVSQGVAPKLDASV